MSRTRLLASMAIFGALLVGAVWSLGGIMTKQNADAQATGTHDAGNNMTSSDTMTTTTRSTDNMTMMATKTLQALLTCIIS